jgi:hypothetical protein
MGAIVEADTAAGFAGGMGITYPRWSTLGFGRENAPVWAANALFISACCCGVAAPLELARAVNPSMTLDMPVNRLANAPTSVWIGPVFDRELSSACHFVYKSSKAFSVGDKLCS